MTRSLAVALLLSAALLAVPAAAGTGPEPADARFSRATRLMEAGKLEEAYAILEKLAEEHPVRWGERARKRMEEIGRLATARDQAREEAGRLREAAEGAAGELGPWLLLESARCLFDVRLYAEALEAASAAAAAKGTRFASAAELLSARCHLSTGRTSEAEKSFRAVLADRGAGRQERGAAWRGLEELLAGAARGEQLREILEEHIGRGPEEPGVAEAVDRFVAVSLVGEKEALRAGKVLAGVIKSWPPGEVSPEWVLAAAKVAEFADRDYSRADRLYRLVLERYPEACFDLTLIKSGRRGGDAGREVILTSIGRVEKKQKGEIKPLRAPRAAERDKSAEKALAAVLCALRDGDLEVARECAAGRLAQELGTKSYPYRRWALSDYEVLEVAETGPDAAEVGYRVAGELGVTRVLEKKASAVRQGEKWKISELGM